MYVSSSSVYTLNVLPAISKNIQLNFRVIAFLNAVIGFCTFYYVYMKKSFTESLLNIYRKSSIVLFVLLLTLYPC